MKTIYRFYFDGFIVVADAECVQIINNKDRPDGYEVTGIALSMTGIKLSNEDEHFVFKSGHFITMSTYSRPLIPGEQGYVPSSRFTTPAIRIKVDDLDFSLRCLNILRSLDITYLDEITNWTFEDLKKKPHMAPKSLNEICEMMESKGLSFKSYD